jgi:ketosteroid isomerase-like protein
MDSGQMKASATAFMTEFSSGDRAAAWRRATDDVRWTVNQHSIPKGELAVFDRAAYDAMVESSGDLFPQGITIEVTDAVAENDRVMLEARGHGALADGRIYANHYIFTFRFRGDRICEVAEYLDTAYAQGMLAFVMEAPGAAKS